MYTKHTETPLAEKAWGKGPSSLLFGMREELRLALILPPPPRPPRPRDRRG
jgi:hypothetical protein